MPIPNENLSIINQTFINQLVDRCNEVGVERVLQEIADILSKERLNKEKFTKTAENECENSYEKIAEALVLGVMLYGLNWLIGIPSINNQLKNFIEDEHNKKVMIVAVFLEMICLLVHKYAENIMHMSLANNLSGQGNLIERIIDFSKNAKIDDELVLPLFTDSMESISNNDNTKLKLLREGICLGLDSLFLFSSFISDMQDESQEQEPRDDLRWFYKCIMLLQFPTGILSSEQKHELARFISIVIHLQNSVVLTNLYDENDPNNNIKTEWHHNLSAFNRVLTTSSQDDNKTESNPPTPKKPGQRTHMLNFETTGENYIDFGGTRQFQSLEELIFLLNNANSPLYISMALTLNNGSHAIGLHRNKNGIITYFDPNYGFATVNLTSIADLEKFVQDYINKYQLGEREYLYNANDVRKFLVNAFFTIGIPTPKPNRSFNI